MTKQPWIKTEAGRAWRRNYERARIAAAPPEVRKAHSRKTMEWRRNLPESRRKAAVWRGNLSKFGITPEQYERMLESQDHVCAICRKPENGGRRLSIDHCHTTKVNRGLLCRACNTALNRLDTIPDWASKATEYLTRSKERH